MSLSKGQRFTDSELQDMNAWTAWQDFGMPHSESVDSSETTRLLTVDEIEAMQKQAYDEAFSQGRDEGFLQGKEDGFAEGLKQGIEAGTKQGYDDSVHLLHKRAAELQLLMETLKEPFRILDERVEVELAELAIAIAKQVVRREIERDPSQIVAVIREAISFLPSAAQKVTMILHPDDAELVRSALKLDDSLPDWHLTESSGISRGGCRVETETSHIDATLENRVNAIIATVLDADPAKQGV